MKVKLDRATHTIKVVDVATHKSKNIPIHTEMTTEELIKKLVEGLEAMDG